MRAQGVVPGITRCSGCLAEWDTLGDYRERLHEIRKLLDALRYFSSDRDPWALEMVIEDHSGNSVQGGP